MSTVQVWTIKAGDNLPVIAAKVFSDSKLWRLIADANEIHNPLLFPQKQDLGRVLLIPRQKK